MVAFVMERRRFSVLAFRSLNILISAVKGRSLKSGDADTTIVNITT